MFLFLLSCTQTLPKSLVGAWVHIMASEQDRDLRSLIFTSGDKVKGNSGCGTFDGKVTVSEGNIRLYNLSLHKKNCKERRLGFEQRYMKQMRATKEWTLEGNILTLLGTEGTLIFRKESQSDRY